MDCAKFDQHVIDELYDELDELTHAALERHVAGCSRCAGVLEGLRATREVGILPLEEPPADLEDKILAAVAAAEPKAPPAGKVIRVLSWTRRQAARPQLAIAAAFVLLLGASAIVFSNTAARKDSAAPAAAVAEPPSPPAVAAATAAPAATAAAPEPTAVANADEPPAASAEAAAADAGAAQATASRRVAGPMPAAKPTDPLDGRAGAGAPAGRAAPKAAVGAPNPRARAAPAKDAFESYSR